MQCQNYDYRLFTSVGYGRGSWNLNIRHQYWPELKSNQCRTNAQAGVVRATTRCRLSAVLGPELQVR
jgi:hypothetical protein